MAATNNIAKSQSLVRALIDQLSKRLPTWTLTESLTNGGDTLMVSQSATPTAGQSNAAILIGYQDTQFNDVIGNPQNVYTPMEAQIVEEASAASASVSLVTLSFQLCVMVELGKMGIKQAWYLNPNGTVPAVSQFSAVPTAPTGATLQINIAPDQYWPLSGQ